MPQSKKDLVLERSEILKLKKEYPLDIDKIDRAIIKEETKLSVDSGPTCDP